MQTKVYPEAFPKNNEILLIKLMNENHETLIVHEVFDLRANAYAHKTKLKAEKNLKDFLRNT